MAAVEGSEDEDAPLFREETFIVKPEAVIEENEKSKVTLTECAQVSIIERM